MLTAGRARILRSYAAGHGYSGDGEYSARAWLMHRTKVTRAAARGYVAWARRAAAHPQVVAALAEGTVLSESVAKAVCGWTDRLPEDCRDAADAILVAAARAGADEEDLAGLAAEILARSQPDRPDEDGDGFDDREIRLETTYDGAAWLDGDAAHAVCCDASIVPVVTGEADLGVLDDLVGLCVILGGHHGCAGGGQSKEAPGEPAQFSDPRSGPGLPGQPGGAGGSGIVPLTASVRTCGLYCFFHHQVAIHKWGWTVTLNPDGTTTARSPDGTKVLRSHGPPPRPG